MSKALLQSVFLIAVGAFFLIHCYRAGRKELRAGMVEGLRGTRYYRGQPGFTVTIVLTFAASAMGAAFLLIGLLLLIGSIKG